VVISNPNINIRQYSQALNILLRAHFDSENYKRIGDIAPHITNSLSDESVLITARAFYHLENYPESIKYFERARPTNNPDIILWCSAYVQNNNRARAESILRNAPENSNLLNSAQENEILKPIVNEIRSRRSPNQ
jgi:tetratricopeptide (TPR) repeat protein